MRLTIPTSLSPRYNPNPTETKVGVVAPEIWQSAVAYLATLSGHIQAVEGEVLEEKIGRHLQRALQPAVTKVSLTWHGVKNVKQVPVEIPPLFKGDRQLVFAFFQLENPPKPAEDMYILLQIGQQKTKIPLTVSDASASQKAFLSNLAARKMNQTVGHCA
jgi:hypothetical protein